MIRISYGHKKLQERIAYAMKGFGFEVDIINGESVFMRGDKYVRIVCGQDSAPLELAHGRHDAENNLYDDIEIYEYGYMKERGFIEDGISKEIISDVEKYIIH